MNLVNALKISQNFLDKHYKGAETGGALETHGYWWIGVDDGDDDVFGVRIVLNKKDASDISLSSTPPPDAGEYCRTVGLEEIREAYRLLEKI